MALVLLISLLEGALLGPALFGFLMVAITRNTRPAQGSLAPHLVLVVIGMVLSYLSFAFGGESIASALILGLVAGFGHVLAPTPESSPGPWEVLALWALIAMILAGSVTPTDAAIGFGLGAGIGLFVIRLLSTRVPARSEITSGLSASALVSGSLVGVAVAGAVLIGFALFPATPYWVALTVVVVHDSRGVVWARALERTGGTMAGVILGWLVLIVLSGELILTMAAVALLFLQMLFLRVDYTSTVTFLTAAIIVGVAISSGAGTATGLARLGATLVGAAIAITLSWLIGDLGARSNVGGLQTES